MKKITHFFHRPAESELFSPETRRRQTLNIMILGIGLIIVALFIFMFGLDLAKVQYTGRRDIYLGGSLTLVGIAIIFLIERFFSATVTGLLFTILVSVALFFSDTPRAFVEGQSMVFLALPIVLAGLLLRPWASYVAAAAVIILEIIGYYVYQTGVPNVSAFILFFLLAWVVQHSTSALETAVEKEREKSRALIDSEKAITDQNQRIQEISQKFLEVQEQEKHLLAAELHDDLGQSLTSLKLTLELIRRAPSSTMRQEKITEASEMVADMMKNVRNMSLDLRPAMLDDFGLFAALRWWFDLFQARTGIVVLCNYDLQCKDRYKPQVETAAFRIIQEALTNVARHASVWEAQVTLSTGTSLSIEVTDRGAGFDVTKVTRKEADSVGLSGMQERVRLLGGSIEIHSTPGAGTRVIASIPC